MEGGAGVRESMRIVIDLIASAAGVVIPAAVKVRCRRAWLSDE